MGATIIQSIIQRFRPRMGNSAMKWDLTTRNPMTRRRRTHDLLSPIGAPPWLLLQPKYTRPLLQVGLFLQAVRNDGTVDILRLLRERRLAPMASPWRLQFVLRVAPHWQFLQPPYKDLLLQEERGGFGPLCRMLVDFELPLLVLVLRCSACTGLLDSCAWSGIQKHVTTSAF